MTDRLTETPPERVRSLPPLPRCPGDRASSRDASFASRAASSATRASLSVCARSRSTASAACRTLALKRFSASSSS